MFLWALTDSSLGKASGLSRFGARIGGNAKEKDGDGTKHNAQDSAYAEKSRFIEDMSDMTLRKTLFWIHLTVGCVAGAVVFIMSVTGVLLAYQRPITSWVDRDFHSTPPAPGAVRLPIETMLEGITTRNGGLPSAITLRADPTAPAEVSFGREQVFFLDVYTGKILGGGSQGTRSFFQSVENWHRWLGASNEHRPVGRAVTGACNLGFLLLVVSGPFLWLPRKWSWPNVKAILLFRGGLSGRARDFNWHNVAGIWCALPLFVIVLSGIVMSYPWANNLLYRLTGNEVPVQTNGQRSQTERRQTKGRSETDGDSAHQSERTQQREQPARLPDGLNALWVRAEQQAPGWRSITLRMTPSGRGPLTFTIDSGAGGRPDQRSQLTLDRRTAEVVRWEPFSSYNTGRRLRSWFRFLHTGEAGGIAGETVAGIASTGAAALVWTGLWLACRRLLRWRKRRQPMPEHSANAQMTTASR